ncbi:class I SAM-dependent methyltransferase [Patescibacteria group bacterium]|nr:class I SAM-dependent methyltransferase [Patescibacteria group bacterium]
MKNVDYRESHKSPGKGKSYAKSFTEYNYRSMIWKWEQKILKKTISKYFNNRKIDYLDFACGTGRITELIEPYTNISYGADVSQEMLSVAKKKLRKTKLLNIDLTKENSLFCEKFDLITAFRFFLNAQPELKNKTIVELKKLLKPNGLIVFNIHMNRFSPSAIIIRLYYLILKRQKTINTMNIGEVKKMLSLADLKILETHHIGILPIIKEKTILPINPIRKIEYFFSHLKFLLYISRNVIFICSQ